MQALPCICVVGMHGKSTIALDGSLKMKAVNFNRCGVYFRKGRDIPNWQFFLLNPDKHYRLCIPVDVLETACKSFNNVPLIAFDHSSKYRIGYTGRNCKFQYPS